MLETFMSIFEQICISFIDWIPGVFGMWLIFRLTSSLLFSKE